MEHTIHRYFVYFEWFAYTLQCVLFARSGGLWLIRSCFYPQPFAVEPVHDSVFKVLSRVYHKRIDFATISNYNTCMETKTLTIRLPAELLKDMHGLAVAHTRSLNGEVLVALKEYVAKHKHEKKGEDKG